MHLRTYANEAHALIRYAVDVLRARKFALFYQDDSYGQAPLFVARESLKKYGITEWLTRKLGINKVANTVFRGISFLTDV